MTQFVKRYSQAPCGFVWAVVACLVIPFLVPGCAKASDAEPPKEKGIQTRAYWTPQRMREQWVGVHAALKKDRAEWLARRIESLPEINFEILHLVNDRDYPAAARFIDEKIGEHNGIALELNDVLRDNSDKGLSQKQFRRLKGNAGQGHMQQAQIILRFLLPANQNASKSV
ncbi:MAG: hypothetical protein HOP29_02115, partial [Phycisphaerales bacterium]|nr:hypothetical protein [Phycisphaerales bacterium]